MALLQYDPDVWLKTNPEHLWVYDKAILSRKLGYLCGPAGVPVPKPGQYIVRPITNLLGMGLGAFFTSIERDTTSLPLGTFWCEVFEGRHLTFDYAYGSQVVAYEGIPAADNPFAFDRWVKVDDVFTLPPELAEIAVNYRHTNVEVIGGKVIEFHLRGNPDWMKWDADELIVVRDAENTLNRPGYRYVPDPDYGRDGFLIPTR
jgi:hypothetical protein